MKFSCGSVNNSASFNIFRNNGASTNKCSFTNCNTWQYCCSSSNRSAFAYFCFWIITLSSLATSLALRINIVCESNIWTYKNIVFNLYAIKNVHSIFDCNPVSDDDIILDEAMRTYITMISYACTWQNYTVLPDCSVFANCFWLYITQFVYFQFSLPYVDVFLSIPAVKPSFLQNRFSVLSVLARLLFFDQTIFIELCLHPHWISYVGFFLIKSPLSPNAKPRAVMFKCVWKMPLYKVALVFRTKLRFN